MAAIDTWNRISTHQIEGLMVHSQLSDYFGFLGEPGYQCYQEYRYIDESIEMRSIRQYVMSRHNKVLLSGHAVNPNVIPSSWVNYTRFDVTQSDRRNANITAFEYLRTWEQNTKELYTDCAMQFREANNLEDAYKVDELIEDVSDELAYIEKHMLELKAVDYSPEYIMDLQDDLIEDFGKKVSKYK